MLVKRISKIRLIATVVLIVLYSMIAPNLCAQSLKTGSLSKESKKTWSFTINILDVSPDANWSIFSEIYDLSNNQIYLANHINQELTKLPSLKDFKFITNPYYLVYLTRNNELIIKDLHNGKSFIINNVSKFSHNPDKKQLAYLKKIENKNSLIIQNLLDNKTVEFSNIEEFEWQSDYKYLLAVKLNNIDKKVVMIDEKKGIIKNFGNFSKESKLSWKGKAFETGLYIKEKLNGITTLNYFTSLGQSFLLNDSIISEYFPGSKLSDKEIYVSEKGEVYFYRKSSEEFIKNDRQIWNTNDVWLYPRLRDFKRFHKSDFLTLWIPSKKNLKAIEDEKMSVLHFNPNHSYSLVADLLQHEPSYKQYPYVDIYMKNNKSGALSLIQEQVYLGSLHLSVSPSGSKFCFFNDRNWWIYDVKNNLMKNLTEKLDDNFYNEDDWPQHDKAPLGKPLWYEEEDILILQGHFDIWKIDIKSDISNRITNSKQQNVRHKIYKKNNNNPFNVYDPLLESTAKKSNINDDLIIEILTGDLKHGLALWNKNSGLKELFVESEMISQIHWDMKFDKFIYLKSRYNISPSIKMKEISLEEKTIYQSNLDLMKKDLGFDKLIYFKVDSVHYEKGVLIYPTNFDPNKKYPMITWIYEKNYKEINRFIPPTKFNQSGFNILNYILNDYFVFLPGIHYEWGAPGESALRSIESAIHEVLKIKNIDPQRLGLIGHSFGGYETAYIITRSNLFKTGVAGGTISDLYSLYHDVQWNGWNTEQMWRMEDHILRMGDSYYNMKEKYHFNSPLYHIESLETPLLLWVGRNDYNSNWYQSIFMYNAMRRLGKEGRFILFENDGHALSKPENQSMLTIEIMKWFDKYLKN